jgi:hypothetical protein
MEIVVLLAAESDVQAAFNRFEGHMTVGKGFYLRTVCRGFSGQTSGNTRSFSRRTSTGCGTSLKSLKGKRLNETQGAPRG